VHATVRIVASRVVRGTARSTGPAARAVMPLAMPQRPPCPGDGMQHNQSQCHQLKGVSLNVEKGCITTLLGANGAGKTTTLKAISGLLYGERGEVTQGAITLDGESIKGRAAHELVTRGVAQVFEGRRAFANLTVEENLMVGGHIRPSREQVRTSIEQVYALFPRLRERRKQDASYLSDGEQQMLAIGRALIRLVVAYAGRHDRQDRPRAADARRTRLCPYAMAPAARSRGAAGLRAMGQRFSGRVGQAAGRVVRPFRPWAAGVPRAGTAHQSGRPARPGANGVTQRGMRGDQHGADAGVPCAGANRLHQRRSIRSRPCVGTDCLAAARSIRRLAGTVA
jgi:ABC-type transport system involved in cytochrome c biogenesis ATPase subunit